MSQFRVARLVARGRLRRGRRHRRDGARRARAADLARVRGRGRAPGAPAGAGPGAAGRRGARPRRRAVHRQDRHAHRGQAGARDRVDAARRDRPGTGRWPRWPPPTRRRTRRCGRSPRRYPPAPDGWRAGRRRPVLLARASGAPRRSAATGRGSSARPTCSCGTRPTRPRPTSRAEAAAGNAGVLLALAARGARPGDALPEDLEPVAVVVLGDRVRPDAADDARVLRRAGRRA